VLHIVDGDDVLWHRIPEFGHENETTAGICPAELTREEYNSEREETAALQTALDNTGARYFTLRIDTRTIFKRATPHQDDLWRVVAHTLTEYPDIDALDPDKLFETGSEPLLDSTQQNRRESNNRSLKNF
jgi:hypothetical protein